MNTDTLWRTSASGVAFAPCLYFGRLLTVLQEKSAQKKPLSFSVSSLAAWCVRFCVGISAIAFLASFCGRLQLNHLDQQQTQRTKLKGELRSSVTRRSSPIEIGTTERMVEADAYIK